MYTQTNWSIILQKSMSTNKSIKCNTHSENFINIWRYLQNIFFKIIDWFSCSSHIRFFLFFYRALHFHSLQCKSKLHLVHYAFYQLLYHPHFYHLNQIFPLSLSIKSEFYIKDNPKHFFSRFSLKICMNGIYKPWNITWFWHNL